MQAICIADNTSETQNYVNLSENNFKKKIVEYNELLGSVESRFGEVDILKIALRIFTTKITKRTNN